MQINGDDLIFSTGRRIYAHASIVGLCLDVYHDGFLEVFQGYDGTIDLPEDIPEDYNADERLTPAECVELADEMLKQWAKFRARYAER